MPEQDIMDEIDRISSKGTLQAADVEALSGYIEKLQSAKKDKSLTELAEIFPALSAYKGEHSIVNLRKLCVEIADFCRAVYASTQNEAEREVYRAMLGKLNI